MFQFEQEEIGESIAALQQAVESSRRVEQEKRAEVAQFQDTLSDWQRRLDETSSELIGQRTVRDQLKVATNEARKLYEAAEKEVERRNKNLQTLIQKDSSKEAIADAEKGLRESVDRQNEFAGRFHVNAENLKLVEEEIDKLTAMMEDAKANRDLAKKQYDLASASLTKLVANTKSAQKKLDAKRASLSKKPAGAAGVKKRPIEETSSARATVAPPARERTPYASGNGAYQQRFEAIVNNAGSVASFTVERVVVAAVRIYDRDGVWMWLPTLLRTGDYAQRVAVGNALMKLTYRIETDTTAPLLTRQQARQYTRGILAMLQSDQHIFNAEDPDFPAGQQRTWEFLPSLESEPFGSVLSPATTTVPWGPNNSSYADFATRLANAALAAAV